MRKSIMSALFGQAYDRGQIDLDATLGQLGIDDTPSLTDNEKSATINDLLAARSGVYLPTEGGDGLGRPARGSHPLGAFWCYNNWDFNVLGNIYERITGRSVFVAFDHDLARPLGMIDWDAYQHGSYSTAPISSVAQPGTRTTRFICRREISPGSGGSTSTMVSGTVGSCSHPNGLRAALAPYHAPTIPPDC